MESDMNRRSGLLGLMAALVVAAGCTSYRVSNTARTPEEQMLLSRAADEAIAKSADFSVYAGKRVFLDVSNLECVDKPYVVDALRQALSAAGARVVDKAEPAVAAAPEKAVAAGDPPPKPRAETTPARGGCCAVARGDEEMDDDGSGEMDGDGADDEAADDESVADDETAAPEPAAAAPVLDPGADVIVTVRAGMLGTQHGEGLLGIPAFKVPVPMVGTVETPEIAFFKRIRQDGKARLCVSGYTRADRVFVAEGSGAGVGRTNVTRWTVFILVHFTTTSENVKELK